MMDEWFFLKCKKGRMMIFSILKIAVAVSVYAIAITCVEQIAGIEIRSPSSINRIIYAAARMTCSYLVIDFILSL